MDIMGGENGTLMGFLLGNRGDDRYAVTSPIAMANDAIRCVLMSDPQKRTLHRAIIHRE
jgi:hypothetical protein